VQLKKLVFFHLLILCFSVQASQQKNQETRWQRWGDDFLSPWTTDARPFLLIGSTFTILAAATRRQHLDNTSEEFNDHRPLGDAAEVGDILGQLVPNILYTGGMGLHAHFAKNKESNRRAWLMVRATAWSGGVTTVLKYTIREPRRYDHNIRNSFPSGHTTTAFAFASVVGAEHGLSWGIPAYAIATLVGVSRVNDNAHYPHDVVAGATIGITYGLGLYYMDKKRANASSDTSQTMVVPLTELNGAAVVYSKDF
jgi:membrane-associated phospholipid phosphatase